MKEKTRIDGHPKFLIKRVIRPKPSSELCFSFQLQPPGRLVTLTRCFSFQLLPPRRLVMLARCFSFQLQPPRRLVTLARCFSFQLLPPRRLVTLAPLVALPSWALPMFGGIDSRYRPLRPPPVGGFYIGGRF